MMHQGKDQQDDAAEKTVKTLDGLFRPRRASGLLERLQRSARTMSATVSRRRASRARPPATRTSAARGRELYCELMEKP